MLIKSKFVHIDTANKIAVSDKAAGFACPISSLGLVFVPTCRTLATCASFRASEAHDVSLFGFVREVVDVLAIFPQGHALIMVSPTVLVANAMRIANEEGAHFVVNAEVDDLVSGLVSLIANAAFGSGFDLVLGFLQHFRCFHLSSSHARKEFWSGFQPIHTHCIHGSILAWKQMGYKWVKPDGAIIRSAIIWFGYPNTEEKSLRGRLKQKPRSLSLNAVSSMTSRFWHWRQIRTMFMFLSVHLPGLALQPLQACSKVIPHDTFEKSSHISKSCVEKSTCGQVRIMLAQQEVFRRKSYTAILRNAKENNRKGKSRRFR